MFLHLSAVVVKNLLACDGHPVGEEIDFAGFVCSRQATCIVLFCFVFIISLHFRLIVLLVY